MYIEVKFFKKINFLDLIGYIFSHNSTILKKHPKMALFGEDLDKIA